ncbi:MAG: hypothetical protein IKA85_07640 [Clostridia bacterium]|nr:hypothetical protein [Clostridia bacterium]
MDTDNEKVKKALLKRAVGYEAQEVTEEYTDDGEGGVKMVKRKVVSKNVPPDVSAVKLLVELSDEEDVKNLSDEELENEKLRLLKLLEKAQKEDL